ncbi:helix-hairpin-helix domain-containing protein [Acidovorax lacteus]|uniref:Pathogenicity locus n=1 Tax=Acidovorax lacteus TaxID=1924988 RepID=A0ABP8LL06_9BURK
MPFPLNERKVLLACKGVGPTVVARLEQMGYLSLAQLAKANVLDVLDAGAQLSGSSCWKNSPQARAAIGAALDAARAHHAH